jgi:NTE family protein
MAIPGVFPPVVGNRDLLVDGGVFNNMPVDVMARMGVYTILAVDLRPQDRPREITFERMPNVWKLLMDRFRPRGARRYEVPTLITTLMAANTLNSQQKMSQVVGDVDLLFRPDVQGFGLLEWKSYDLLVERGYEEARAVLGKHPWPIEGSG